MSTPTRPSPAQEQPTPGAPGPDRVSPVRRVLSGIGVQNSSLIITLVVLIIVLSTLNDNFFRTNNLLLIGSAVTIMGLLSLVQTLVIILGALDISVGSMAGLASVISAMAFTATGSSAIGILAAVGTGIACGLVNGLIIIFGRVNPVVATLATLATYKGIAQVVSDGKAQGYTGADDLFIFLAKGTVLGLPTLVWVFLIVAAILHFLLKYTDIGRNIFAIGGNDTAARLAGININRYIIGVYALVGVVAAIAGVLITARTGSGQPTSGSEGLELQAVTGAALGGTMLKGGKGSIVSTVLAVFILGVLDNGMSGLGINQFWQNVAHGALLVVAVVLQQLRSGERRVGLPA
ncbi:ABC transporter permease [Amycolatopsis saalfeldensis]|uniref:Ribose transport system permease protein n=1 Tax=Amycolatopsis saalfeldensis TaxID=394193 RepID=A0A1H8YE74_9PSEU|nr:ABC transporter permease [Amycolatopsis saalfeldensis]SEP50435.1 ribose transport system permease protein [Amycolatopsis saalfeldensis]